MPKNRALLEELIATVVEKSKSSARPLTTASAGYLVKAIVLEHADDFQDRPDFDSEENVPQTVMDSLLEHCLSTVAAAGDSPFLDTLVMQVEFDAEYIKQSQHVENQSGSPAEESAKLMGPILDARPKSKAQTEELYDNIVNYIVASHGPEAGSHKMACQETAADLDPVLPASDLTDFVALPADEKEAQLGDLASIILGIRLFNKESGIAGGEIKDFRASPAEEAYRLVSMVDGVLVPLETELANYMSVVNQLYFQGVEDTGDDQAKWLLKRLSEELTNRRQFHSYLKIIQEDLETSRDRQKEVRDVFNSVMSDLKNTVSSRSVVPTNEVYPLFTTLAQLWHRLRAESHVVSSREDVLKALMKFRTSFSTRLSEDLVAGAKTSSTGTDTDSGASTARSQVSTAEPSSGASTNRVVKFADEVIVPPGKGARILDPENTGAATRRERIEYKGFCPTTIVDRDGLLLLGDASHGIVAFQGHHYVFASVAARDVFLEKPETYVEGVLKAAQQHPALVHLLGVNESFPGLASLDLGGRHATSGAGLEDLLNPKAKTAVASTDTPVHFVESHVDPKYHWNEWELRRRALRLADMRKRATHSTQTMKSHFRRDATSQVYPAKAGSTQTPVARGTNTAKQLQIVQGLRGAPASLGLSVVNISLDITAGKSSVDVRRT